MKYFEYLTIVSKVESEYLLCDIEECKSREAFKYSAVVLQYYLDETTFNDLTLCRICYTERLPEFYFLGVTEKEFELARAVIWEE